MTVSPVVIEKGAEVAFATQAVRPIGGRATIESPTIPPDGSCPAGVMTAAPQPDSSRGIQTQAFSLHCTFSSLGLHTVTWVVAIGSKKTDQKLTTQLLGGLEVAKRSASSAGRAHPHGWLRHPKAVLALSVGG